jgi:hypothetical protein
VAWRGQTLSLIGEGLGVSLQRVKQLRENAFKDLRRDQRLCRTVVKYPFQSMKRPRNLNVSGAFLLASGALFDTMDGKPRCVPWVFEIQA